MCVTGSEETLQPTKPSFLQYFEQKEKEAGVQKDGVHRQTSADERRPEGDLQVVSSPQRPAGPSSPSRAAMALRAHQISPEPALESVPQQLQQDRGEKPEAQGQMEVVVTSCHHQRVLTRPRPSWTLTLTNCP